MEDRKEQNSALEGRKAPRMPIPTESHRAEPWGKSLPEDLSGRRPVAYSPELAAVQASQLKARTQWQDLKEQATLAYESGLLPKSIDSRERAITIALMGKELGLAPMQSLCGIYVVNGMMALRGGLMLRLIYERVPGARISVLTPPEQADQECAVEMQRPSGVAQVFRFTVEDARKAGFMNKPIWQQHTATMLRWAAIRSGARVIFADAIAGCYMEDEIPHSEAAATTVVETPVLPARAESGALRADAGVETAAEAEPEAAGDVQTSMPIVPEPPVSRYSAPRTVVSSLPRTVTEKQVNRLFAIARDKRWTRPEVAQAIEKWFGKYEAKELNRAEYDKLCQHLLENGSKDFLAQHAS